MIAIAGQNVVF